MLLWFPVNVMGDNYLSYKFCFVIDFVWWYLLLVYLGVWHIWFELLVWVLIEGVCVWCGYVVCFVVIWVLFGYLIALLFAMRYCCLLDRVLVTICLWLWVCVYLFVLLAFYFCA